MGHAHCFPTVHLSDQRQRRPHEGKVKALELLAKHLGMFDSKNGGSEAPENNIFEVIDQSTREEIGTDEIPEIEHPAKPGHDLVE